MPSRRWAHRSLYECFRLQSWPRREMVVLETGGDGEDSAFWRGVARADRRVRYIYERKDMALGPKRNRFLKLVEGEVVAQFDDDDVYAPSYLDTMVAALLEPCLDDLDCVDDVVLEALLDAPRIAKLASWVGYDVWGQQVTEYRAADDRDESEAREAERERNGMPRQAMGWHSRFYGCAPRRAVR